MSNSLASSKRLKKFQEWFLEGSEETKGKSHSHQPKAWWQVMCLTGVDYFSTLGFQPYLAFLAAGALSPIATIFLVALTLFGALPMYSRVAEESPHGQGSVSMLEHLLPGWTGKTFVLCLLGFAATDFILTVTLSAADATAHVIENPFVPHWLHHQVLVTFVLILALGIVFLKGFSEAINLAVILVAIYLLINTIVVGRTMIEIFHSPKIITNWYAALAAGPSQAKPWLVIGLALLVFPKLAVGLSGFETGVTVMPLIKGGNNDNPEKPQGRIRNARKLLFTSAIIMSLLLIGSNFATTLLIPAKEFETGGKACGRAVAYLAHVYFGEGFGTFYDFSTAAILWYAGASAMAGMLNLIPRYLPRYGMAPEWARANRPLIVVITLVNLFVTWIFNADVEAQGGAYATGLLMLISSAAVAVAISAWRKKSWHRWGFMFIALVFIYTTITNVIERPEGLKISLIFIFAIIIVSLLSRVFRSTELRIDKVILDKAAKRFVKEAIHHNSIHIVANRFEDGLVAEYDRKKREMHKIHRIAENEPFLILEVTIENASEFTNSLFVEGIEVGPYRILRCKNPTVANAIAAFLLHLQHETGIVPDAYFGWTEGNPVSQALKYLFWGEGDTAPITREVLRRSRQDPDRRPHIHVA